MPRIDDGFFKGIMRIIIATIKSWNIERVPILAGLNPQHEFFGIRYKNELEYEYVKGINPDWIFFPHWSWTIPKEIYENWKCVVFHMTDLPFGRGGSPLQNLILNHCYKTRISAVKVVEGIDRGPIYCKSEEIDIGYGSAGEILKNISDYIFNSMIPLILQVNPEPKEQEGRPFYFQRLRDNSELKGIMNKADCYDYIRMLDGEGYERAWAKIGNISMTFYDAKLEDGKVMGRFEIV